MSETKLSAKQRAFVREFVRLGGRNATAAAIAAGYGGGAHVSAHRLLQRDYILAAIKAETERRLRADVAVAYDVLLDLAKNADSESVRFNAAQAVLDRGGMQLSAKTEHHHIIEDKRTDGELLERIGKLSRELGIKTIPGEAIDLKKALTHMPGAPLPIVEIIPSEAERVTNAVADLTEEDIFR